MIYSDEYRMACIECLTGHRQNRCTHVEKIYTGHVFICDDRGSQKSSTKSKIGRRCLPARRSMIRVVAGVEIQPLHRCPRQPEFSVFQCHFDDCSNCKYWKDLRVNAYLDSSTVILQHLDHSELNEELFEKVFTLNHDKHFNNEGKSVPQNLPNSAHLMRIHNISYLDHIGYFQLGSSITTVIKKYLMHCEKQIVDKRRSLEERSPLFLGVAHGNKDELVPTVSNHTYNVPSWEIPPPKGEGNTKIFKGMTKPKRGITKKQKTVTTAAATAGQVYVPEQRMIQHQQTQQPHQVQGINAQLQSLTYQKRVNPPANRLPTPQMAYPAQTQQMNTVQPHYNNGVPQQSNSYQSANNNIPIDQDDMMLLQGLREYLNPDTTPVEGYQEEQFQTEQLNVSQKPQYQAQQQQVQQYQPQQYQAQHYQAEQQQQYQVQQQQVQQQQFHQHKQTLHFQHVNNLNFPHPHQNNTFQNTNNNYTAASNAIGNGYVIADSTLIGDSSTGFSNDWMDDSNNNFDLTSLFPGNN